MPYRDVSLPDLKPTTELYIPTVLQTTECRKHKVPNGVPCFHVPKQTGDGYYSGICNGRAKRAGLNNPIAPSSLFQTARRIGAKSS